MCIQYMLFLHRVYKFHTSRSRLTEQQKALLLAYAELERAPGTVTGVTRNSSGVLIVGFHTRILYLKTTYCILLKKFILNLDLSNWFYSDDLIF